jgi:hypothetical protein
MQRKHKKAGDYPVLFTFYLKNNVSYGTLRSNSNILKTQWSLYLIFTWDAPKQRKFMNDDG